MRVDRDESALSAYLDEMLDAKGMREVRGLLDSQPEARRQYKSMTHTVHRLKHLPDPEPPPDFWPDTYQALRDFAASGRCRRSSCRAARGVILALACLLALGGAVALAHAKGQADGTTVMMLASP